MISKVIYVSSNNQDSIYGNEKYDFLSSKGRGIIDLCAEFSRKYSIGIIVRYIEFELSVSFYFYKAEVCGNLKEELQEIIEMSDSIIFENNDELVSDFSTITLRFEC